MLDLVQKPVAFGLFFCWQMLGSSHLAKKYEA